MGEILAMSEKELDRCKIIESVKDKNITQKDAATIIGVTDRCVRKLLTKLKKEGRKGLISAWFNSG